MTPFNDVRRVTSDRLSAAYGPDKHRPLVVTLHANGQGDFILLRPLGTTRTVRVKVTDLYRSALFQACGQLAARVRQLRREGHSLASARRQAISAIFATPAPRPARRQPAREPATRRPGLPTT